MSGQVVASSPSVVETAVVELPLDVQEECMPAPLEQSTCLETTARVILTYTGLSRTSKRFLERILLDWAKWHASTYQSMGNSVDFEAGKYEYDPTAIAVQDTVVMVDKPDAQRGNTQAANSFNVQYETANQVPKYDRSSEAVLQPVRFDKEGEPVALPSTARQERRCHNCGSYAHVVQACPKEKDPNEIRQRAQERGGGGNRSRPSTVRYYANPEAPIISGGEEYVGLQAGQLASETREALGLGPLDPPPWLDKMRQLGYPPMYKHNKRKDELFIFDDQTGNSTAAARGTKASTSQAEDKLQHGQELVTFPGVNAPAPPGADARLWGVPLAQLPSEAGSKRSQPEYPTQEDIAAAPPLKRVKPNEPQFHPFAFNFQSQPAPVQPTSANARDPPFVFTAGAQVAGSAPSWQNPTQNHSLGAHAAAQPQSLAPTGQSSAGANPALGWGGDPNGYPNSVSHSMYQGFAPPPQHSGHAGTSSQLTPNAGAAAAAVASAAAASAYGHSFYGMGTETMAYAYGTQPPSHHMGFHGMHYPGMHPSYAAYAAAQAMSTQYPYPPHYSAPYPQTPLLNSQPSSDLPPPPPPFPPV